jgi:hypothetical protein
MLCTRKIKNKIFCVLVTLLFSSAYAKHIETKPKPKKMNFGEIDIQNKVHHSSRTKLTKKMINTVLQQNYKSLQKCASTHHDELKKKQKVKLDMKFKICSSGTVSSTNILPSHHESSAFGKCLIKQLGKLKFPTHKDLYLTVTTPVTFHFFGEGEVTPNNIGQEINHSTQPTLTPKMINNVLNDNHENLYECIAIHDNETEKQQKIRLRLRIKICSCGNVSSVDLLPSDYESSAFGKCLIKQVGKLKFPSHKNLSVTTLVPITIHRSE